MAYWFSEFNQIIEDFYVDGYTCVFSRYSKSYRCFRMRAIYWIQFMIIDLTFTYHQTFLYNLVVMLLLFTFATDTWYVWQKLKQRSNGNKIFNLFGKPYSYIGRIVWINCGWHHVICVVCAVKYYRQLYICSGSMQLVCCVIGPIWLIILGDFICQTENKHTFNTPNSLEKIDVRICVLYHSST